MIALLFIMLRDELTRPAARLMAPASSWRTTLANTSCSQARVLPGATQQQHQSEAVLHLPPPAGCEPACSLPPSCQQTARNYMWACWRLGLQRAWQSVVLRLLPEEHLTLVSAVRLSGEGREDRARTAHCERCSARVPCRPSDVATAGRSSNRDAERAR